MNKEIKVFTEYWEKQLKAKPLKEVLMNYVAGHWSGKEITPTEGLMHWLFIQLISSQLEPPVMPNEVVAGGNIKQMLTKGDAPPIAGMYLIKNKYGFRVDHWNRKDKCWHYSNRHDVKKYLFIEK